MSAFERPLLDEQCGRVRQRGWGGVRGADSSDDDKHYSESSQHERVKGLPLALKG